MTPEQKKYAQSLFLLVLSQSLIDEIEEMYGKGLKYLPKKKAKELVEVLMPEMSAKFPNMEMVHELIEHTKWLKSIFYKSQTMFFRSEKENQCFEQDFTELLKKYKL